jgi:hypothetical protein
MSLFHDDDGGDTASSTAFNLEMNATDNNGTADESAKQPGTPPIRREQVAVCALAGLFYGLLYAALLAPLFCATTAAVTILRIRPSTDTLVVALVCLFSEHVMNVALHLFTTQIKLVRRAATFVRYVFSVTMAAVLIGTHLIMHQSYFIAGMSLTICAMLVFALSMAVVDLFVLVPRDKELTPLNYVSKVHNTPSTAYGAQQREATTTNSCVHCAHCKAPV